MICSKRIGIKPCRFFDRESLIAIAIHQPSDDVYRGGAGRGIGVGRGLAVAWALGVGVGLGVAVGVAVAVGVGVAVAVAVAVAVGVGVGVPPDGTWISTVMGDPVLKKPTVALAFCGG